MSKKHFNFKSSIRDWYIRAFPSDELGYRINPLATFAGAVKCMADGGDIYKYLGVGDSLVRENVFSKIAAITGVDYDAVYDLWSHHDEDESSRLVFLGDHPDCAVDREIPSHLPADIAAAAKEAAAKSVKPDSVGAGGIKH